MKNAVTTIVLLTGLLIAPVTQATIINFNNTTPANSFNAWDSSGVAHTFDVILNGHYTESGFTLTATGNTNLVTFDPLYDAAFLAQDGTDFASLGNGARTGTLSAAAPFSLQSFYAANLGSAGLLTLTGHISGSPDLVRNFNVAGAGVWTFFSLTGWNDLTSVDFAAQGTYLSLDNLTVNDPVLSVPEPSMLLLLSAAIAGLGFFKKTHGSKRVI